MDAEEGQTYDIDEETDHCDVLATGENIRNKAESEEVEHLKRIVKKFIDIRKNDKGNVLPDPQCVRKNHNLISVYIESKIADEIVDKQAFIIPDGTSRQGIGEMAAAVVKVGDRIRAIKGVKIGKGDRANWAQAIYHMLDRLATASSKDISTIWNSRHVK